MKTKLILSIPVLIFAIILCGAVAAVPSQSADSLININGHPVDVNSLVQYVMRETYLENNNDLKDYANKIKSRNLMKNSLRHLYFNRIFPIQVNT